MPLRDHFRPPVKDRHPWDGFHAGWPMMIVQQLFDILPDGYNAEPGIHLGRAFEVDVSTFEDDAAPPTQPTGSGNGGVATLAPPEPTLMVETDLGDQDEYEVRLYDVEHGRQLVAAIEIVSPSNKDRPQSRRAFTAKVSSLLQKNVCVSIVDLVTVRQFNLYAEMLEQIDVTDPQLGANPPHLYSVTMRTITLPQHRSFLQAWYYPMTIGATLPTLPIWLNEELRVLLPLEAGYQETCRLLHVP